MIGSRGSAGGDRAGGDRIGEDRLEGIGWRGSAGGDRLEEIGWRRSAGGDRLERLGDAFVEVGDADLAQHQIAIQHDGVEVGPGGPPHATRRTDQKLTEDPVAASTTSRSADEDPSQTLLPVLVTTSGPKQALT